MGLLTPPLLSRAKEFFNSLHFRTHTATLAGLDIDFNSCGNTGTIFEQITDTNLDQIETFLKAPLCDCPHGVQFIGEFRLLDEVCTTCHIRTYRLAYANRYNTEFHQTILFHHPKRILRYGKIQTVVFWACLLPDKRKLVGGDAVGNPEILKEFPSIGKKRFPRQRKWYLVRKGHGPMMTFHFLILLGVMFFLSGCGNNPHPPPLCGKGPDNALWQVGYRGFPDDPRSLDPQVSYDTIGNAVIANIYECPLQYHPFKVDPYELVPCLLEEMPKRIQEKDGRESYFCKLKHRLYFHKDPCFVSAGGMGREVVADDMAYAFKRIADPQVECPVLSTLQDYVMGLKEAYEEARKTGKFDYSKPLLGVEVIDDYTFRLHLLKAYPQIQYWLAMPFTAPVPHEAVEYYDGKMHDGKVRDQFKFHPVGTGPFRLVEWQRNHFIRLGRHERYTATTFPQGDWSTLEEARFRPLAGKTVPFLDEVQLTIIRESIPRWLLFRQGYLDSTGIGKDIFNSVINVSQELTAEYRKQGVQLHKDAELATFFLTFNMEDSVVGNNQKLRQAVSSAYDEKLANIIFHNGIYEDAQQLLPPGVFGYQPGFRNPYKQHDIALAKKLLAEAGYPEGHDMRTGKQLELTLDVTVDDPESRQYAEFCKNQIESLGIAVKVEENLWARQQEKFDSGHFQIITYGWNADYPDPENFFFLFYSRNKVPQGNNYARYSNPEFDRVFERMRTMDNTPERLQLVYQLNRILTEDCPWVLQSHPVFFTLHQVWSPRVFSHPLLAGGFKYVKVDVELRAQKQREWNQPIYWPLWLGFGTAMIAMVFGVYWNWRHDV